MRPKLLLAFFLCLCGMGLPLRAQLVPSQGVLEFGDIEEAKGPVTARAYLLNKGDDPLSITRVRTTCGCTGVDYYKDVINPGDSAFVDITYDPRRRFGEFEKSVKVHVSDGNTVPVVFHGYVINTEETIALRYPCPVGPLRLSETKVLGGVLNKGEQRSLFVNFYNMSDSEVTPTVSCDNPGLSVSLGPTPVPPHSVGSISIIPNCKEDLTVGRHQLEIRLNPDASDPSSEEQTIDVFLEIE